MTLEELFWKQYELQTDSFKIDFENMSFEERRRYVTYNVLALENELHEALGEIDWKPWSEGEVFHRDAFLKELVDAFHFLMNLALAAGYQPEKVATEFANMYLHKRQVNADRQARGYDGRSDKCDCGRAVEDGLFIDHNNVQRRMVFRCVCGRENCLKMEVT